MPAATLLPSRPSLRRTATKKTTARAKKPFKFELTAEDIALDNAISAAAARSLAARRP
ncbi:MAG: hypothetical protein Q8N18_18835 [Opitutaceae bacterium]|nr:hypothetical protein [Opitutaceae bacterium]